MRIFILVGFSILAFAIGVWASPAMIAAGRHRAEGASLHCLAKGQICVGAPAQKVMSVNLADDLGGLVEVYCGFDRPGDPGAAPIVDISQLIARGCASPKYMAQFSDGRQVSRVWVDHGVVVALSRGPAHAAIDP